MSKFKCPECESICTAEEWNESTRKVYGEDIYEIDSEDAEECGFTCPVCGKGTVGEYIKEIIED